MNSSKISTKMSVLQTEWSYFYLPCVIYNRCLPCCMLQAQMLIKIGFKPSSLIFINTTFYYVNVFWNYMNYFFQNKKGKHSFCYKRKA